MTLWTNKVVLTQTYIHKQQRIKRLNERAAEGIGFSRLKSKQTGGRGHGDAGCEEPDVLSLASDPSTSSSSVQQQEQRFYSLKMAP